MIIIPIGVFLTMDLQRECGEGSKAFVQPFTEGREVSGIEDPVLLTCPRVVPSEDSELISLHHTAKEWLDLLYQCRGFLTRHPLSIGVIGEGNIHPYLEFTACYKFI